MTCKLALGAALVALALAGAANAQTAYDGEWEGVLQAGFQKLRLELHVKTEGKETGALLRSLDQGANIPSSAAKVENGELGVLFIPIGAELKGKLEPDGKTMKATFWQGVNLPVTFTRKAAAAPAPPAKAP